MMYFLLGPPASGKGTQGHLLSEKLDIPFISVGQRLREMAAHHPVIASYVNTGKIIPLTVMTELFETLHTDYRDNCVIDGALRSNEQTEAVLRLWHSATKYVIWLEIPNEVIMERALGRRESNGPARHDDTREVIEERIALYRNTIADILAVLGRHRVRVIPIDGTGTPDAIHQTIIQELLV